MRLQSQHLSSRLWPRRCVVSSACCPRWRDRCTDHSSLSLDRHKPPDPDQRKPLVRRPRSLIDRSYRPGLLGFEQIQHERAHTHHLGRRGTERGLRQSDELHLLRSEVGTSAPHASVLVVSSARTKFPFSLQRIMIDVCKVSGGEAIFLQQAAHLTGGIYLRAQHSSALLQYLMVRSSLSNTLFTSRLCTDAMTSHLSDDVPSCATDA